MIFDAMIIHEIIVWSRARKKNEYMIEITTTTTVTVQYRSNTEETRKKIVEEPIELANRLARCLVHGN